jgi:ribosomal protein S18 acetylase RimI-like enzyme
MILQNKQVSVRSFKDHTDLEFAAFLTKKEGWHSETIKELGSYFAHDREGCLIAEIDGNRIGICFATAYKTSGFIGELIVENSYRNSGIGRLLMEKAIQFLQTKSIKTIFLDGVQKAIPLYESLGFDTICRSLRFFGEIEPKESPEIRNLNNEDLENICILDQNVFGDDRSFFLRQRFTNYPELSLVHMKYGKIQAYLFGRVGNGGWVTAGPWVNFNTPNEQLSILSHFQSTIGNQPFSIGVLENRKSIIKELSLNGMHPRNDPPTRMILGEGKNLGDNQFCFAIGSPAKG